MTKRDRAKRLLSHYFQVIAETARVRLGPDNLSEIEWIVDLIADAAKEELREEFERMIREAIPQR